MWNIFAGSYGLRFRASLTDIRLKGMRLPDGRSVQQSQTADLFG